MKSSNSMPIPELPTESVAYHYDQIQREIKSEVQNLDPQTRSYFIDLTTEFMEESMNWPDPDNQEEFNEQLTNGFQTFLP